MFYWCFKFAFVYVGHYPFWWHHRIRKSDDLSLWETSLSPSPQCIGKVPECVIMWSCHLISWDLRRGMAILWISIIFVSVSGGARSHCRWGSKSIYPMWLSPDHWHVPESKECSWGSHPFFGGDVWRDSSCALDYRVHRDVNRVTCFHPFF